MAESLQDQMFPATDACYARSYSAAHLGQHPAQRVSKILVVPDDTGADSMLTLSLQVSLRGVPGGDFEATAYCQTAGTARLSCVMEGDAGGFQIAPAKGRAILITVGKDGMTFENDTGFATLEPRTGDDRSFLLRPAICP